jgi:hypothetical protein
MPRFRATVWNEPDFSRQVIERESLSEIVFREEVIREFIGDDEDTEQIQFGPVTEVDLEERERRLKRLPKRGFSN